MARNILGTAAELLAHLIVGVPGDDDYNPFEQHELERERRRMMTMIDPRELEYSPSHVWVCYDGDEAYIGITDYVQGSLGELIRVQLPEVDDELETGEPFGEVESEHEVVETISPVCGTVTKVNEDLLDSPEMINESPYHAWLIKVGDITETEDLMDADAYDAYVEEM